MVSVLNQAEKIVIINTVGLIGSLQATNTICKIRGLRNNEK